jgi:enoyl-CoA hydratase/carnithine racemase
MSEEIKVVDRDAVRWIEIDRPESKNGLTIEVNEKIIRALAGAEADPAIRCIVLAGAGGTFCSGLDLRQAMRAGAQSLAATDENIRTYFHGLIRAVRSATRPTVAAVDGAAAGYGCDLALACDVRLISDRARFGEIFVKRGLMPDGGSTFLLPRLIGLGRALELMLTGDLIDAEEAVRIGLANRVIATAEHTDAVWAYARKLAKGPPLVHRAIKEAVAAALSTHLDAALDRERETQLGLLQSADFAEGVAAFFQKREPSFRGK